MKPELIAITGGIGSGKSVVCRILEVLGYEVYDCDARAKSIMEDSAEIKENLVKEFGGDVISEGRINRPYLAELVFNDNQKLKCLNSIVHGAVIRDILQKQEECRDKIMFVETAIVYESGLNTIVSGIWEVTAPENLRIERVMQRNGLSRQQVEARIRSQAKCKEPQKDSGRIGDTLFCSVVNDGRQALLPQIFAHLKTFRNFGD